MAGGTAFTYQLKIGGQLVRNLRLSGETISKIFTNEITNWNDPAITKDNNGRAFPSLPITPVVRSDGSGTTAQFTLWMDNQYPDVWRPFYGKSGLTSYYPREGRAIGQAGSDQVMNTIAGFAGNGTIGYVEYSYPLNKDYPVVKVLNKAGYYVEPTQYNTAVALTKAKINQDPNSQLYLTQILDEVYVNKDPRAYPISSYSYMIIPTGPTDVRMTTAKRQTLADFLYYSLCAGQTKAGPYGYSPLPLNLVQAGFEQIAKLKVADPLVDLTDRDVRSCNNPTFDGKNLSKNKLAEIAPQPAACDKVGEGPCGTDTGTNEPSTDDPNAPTDARHGARGDPGGARRPGDGTDGRRSGRRPGHRRGQHARARRPGGRWRHHRPAGGRLPGADRARGVAAGGHLDVRLGRGGAAARAGAAARPPGLEPAAPTASPRCAVISRRALRVAVRGLRRLAPRRPDAGADAGRRRPRARSPTDNVQRGGGSAFSLTKTLTRSFVNDDGTTYEFPTNTVTVNASQTKDLRGRQRILISWTGAQPSGGRASNPYGENGLQQEYPVVIMQCRGIDDPSAADREAGPAGDLLDRLGGPALPDHPVRRRGGVDPRPAAPRPPTRSGCRA